MLPLAGATTRPEGATLDRVAPQHDIDATASAPGAAPTPRRATWPAGCSCSATTTCARHTGHPPTAPYTQIHFRFDTDTMPGHPHEFLHVTVQNDDRSRVVHYYHDSWTSTWRRPGPGGNPLGADLAGVQAAAVTRGEQKAAGYGTQLRQPAAAGGRGAGAEARGRASRPRAGPQGQGGAGGEAARRAGGRAGPGRRPRCRDRRARVQPPARLRPRPQRRPGEGDGYRRPPGAQQRPADERGPLSMYG